MVDKQKDAAAKEQLDENDPNYLKRRREQAEREQLETQPKDEHGQIKTSFQAPQVPADRGANESDSPPVSSGPAGVRTGTGNVQNVTTGSGATTPTTGTRTVDTNKDA